jgi:SAM-dependent methyltransferase
VSDTPFTGERLHEGSELFAVDLARHHAAYEIARRELGPGWTLDLGCGSGYGTRSLSSPDLKIAGLDRVFPDPAQRQGHGHFVRADLSAVPFRPACFERVVSFQVIEHLEDPTEYIDAIATLLRPNGLALITTPNRLTSDGVNPFHVHEYRADELGVRLGERFDEVELRGIGMSERVRAHMEARSARIRRIMRLDPLNLRGRLPAGLIEWLFGRLAIVVRRLGGGSDDLADVSWRDYPVGPADDGCLDLLAVCRRPRP